MNFCPFSGSVQLADRPSLCSPLPGRHTAMGVPPCLIAGTSSDGSVRRRVERICAYFEGYQSKLVARAVRADHQLKAGFQRGGSHASVSTRVSSELEVNNKSRSKNLADRSRLLWFFDPSLSCSQKLGHRRRSVVVPLFLLSEAPSNPKRVVWRCMGAAFPAP
jgi:hypothetical protein